MTVPPTSSALTGTTGVVARLVVGIGGAVGASSRWAIDSWFGASDWPWALLVVNTVGAAILGGLIAMGPRADDRLQLAVGVGFCGGFTTFSSVMVAAIDLGDNHSVATAGTFLVSSVLVALVAALAVAAFVAGRIER